MRKLHIRKLAMIDGLSMYNINCSPTKKPHHQQIDFVMPSRSLAQSPLASSTKEGKKLSTNSYNEIKYREAGIRFIMLLYYDVRVAVEQ